VKISLRFLGTGSGDGSCCRRRSSLLLEYRERIILFDAGEPCALALGEAGLSATELDAVCLTHAHPDHVGGFPTLIQACRSLGRTEPLDVYLPAFLQGPLEAWLEALALRPERIGFLLRWHRLDPSRSYQQGDVTLQAFPTSHDQKNGRESFGYIVETPAGRLVLSGDLGSAEDLQAPLNKSTQVLVTELSHIEPSKLIELLGPIPLNLLMVVHIGQHLSSRKGNLSLELNQALPLTREVFLPRDGESFFFDSRVSPAPKIPSPEG
jgi:ribonuclease BN (tRNA processing enzyme)